MIVKNRILACLDPVSFRRLAPHLEFVPFRRRAILQDRYHTIDHVYFIESGFASLYARTRADGPFEVAVVGRFGLVGVSALLGTGRSPHRCLMQAPGHTLRISVSDLRAVMDSSRKIRHHLLSYVSALLAQNAQAVLCNGRHHTEARLCRWLLLAADRLDDPVIPITHDILAMNLGIRRASVTDCLGVLRGTGAIAIGRGTCKIVDRAALERRACECYRIVASEYLHMAESGCHEHVLHDGAFATPNEGARTRTVTFGESGDRAASGPNARTCISDRDVASSTDPTMSGIARRNSRSPSR